ncbi:hypothetical protein EA187_12875 [Lujinxingia sediminis]|uniref:KAP NTPase domain-containing protein n=1 Tax=Lujinxingia sediminis TaxID=2480984 RepID=A0ABY0CS32_9DELT|nr:P-loop NTPase fold protein [Lujinxingia sediminis]RVU43102.1 hypothetical protein EA187_12875 [Lujinxingia sediminis]
MLNLCGRTFYVFGVVLTVFEVEGKSHDAGGGYDLVASFLELGMAFVGCSFWGKCVPFGSCESLVFIKQERAVEMGLNTHIENYLEYYFDSDVDARYAVLIHGKWGVGKTFFVNRLKEHWEGTFDDAQILYVSLYGVAKVSDIQDQFFAQMHPVLASKPARIFALLGKDAMRFAYRAPLSHEDKSSVTTSLQAKGVADAVSGWLSEVKGHILIFDDLERCSMSLDVVLGYINSFVEHHGCKVVILANEDEIRTLVGVEGGGDGKQRRYQLVKEKLVGKGFHLQPDVDSAVKSFLRDMKPGVEPVVSPFLEMIVQIHQASGTENLRHLRSTFEEFQRLLMLFPKDVVGAFEVCGEDSPEYLFLKVVIEELTIMLHEVKSGCLSVKDVPRFRSAMLRVAMQSGKESEPYSQRDIEEFGEELLRAAVQAVPKYKAFIHWTTPVGLLPITWGKFFAFSFVPSDELKDGFESFVVPYRGRREPWERLIHVWELDDSEYDDAMRFVDDELAHYGEHRLGVLLHIFGVKVDLALTGHPDYDVKRVVREAKAYVSELKGRRGLVLGPDADRYAGGLIGSMYKNRQFDAWESDEFQEIHRFAVECFEKQQQDLLVECAKLKVVANLHDSQWLYENLTRARSKGEYADVPVLASLEQSQFVSAFELLSLGDRLSVVGVLKARYESRLPDELKRLCAERPLIDALVASVEKARSRHGKATWLAGRVILERLEEVQSQLTSVELVDESEQVLSEAKGAEAVSDESP